MSALDDVAKKRELVIRSFEIAEQKTIEMNLPIRIELPKNVIGLGVLIDREASRFHDSLENKYHGKCPELIAKALSHYWHECWFWATLIGLNIENGFIADDAFNRSQTTAIGYSDYHGCATIIHNSYWFRDSQKGILFGFDCPPSEHHPMTLRAALTCMSLYYFHQAAEEHAQGRITSAFNSLGQAYGCATLIHYNAHKGKNEELKKSFEMDVRSAFGKLGAIERLKVDPKQKEKGLVFDHWKAWQDLIGEEKKRRYKGKAAFARDMLEKFENLESSAVIERWCREWEAVSNSIKQAE